MNNLSAIFLVLIFGDPLRLEGGEGAESGTTGPDGVVSVSGGDDVDDTGLGALGVHLLGKSVSEALVQGGTTGADDVLVQVGSNIEIALGDRLEGKVGDAGGLVTLLDEGGLEDGLGGHEAGLVHLDRLTIGQLVVSLVHGRGAGLLASLLEVEGNERELLLDGAHDLEPGTLATLLSDTVISEELDHVLADNATGNEVLADGVGDGEALEDGDSVGDTIAGVDDETGGTAIGVQGKHSLDGNVETGDLEGLEHDRSHLFSVGLGVAGSLGEEDLVLTGVDTELVGESVLPDLLHIFPRVDNTRLDGVSQVQHTSHLVSLITNIVGLGLDTDELLVGSRATNNGRELDGGGRLAGETGLEDTGSVVNNNSLFLHFDLWLFS